MQLCLGIPGKYLFSLVELAKRKTEGARNQVYTLNAKLNTLWIRLRVLELRLETSLLKNEKECIARSLDRCRQRYVRLLEKRRRRKSLVSNELISELLGIPKGSVDSGLFYLRKNVNAARPYAVLQQIRLDRGLWNFWLRANNLHKLEGTETPVRGA